MWPGLVGKEEGTDHPPISLDRMLELTVNARAAGKKFDGVDLFLFFPHIDIDASEEEILAIADKIAAHGLSVGSLVAPVWPGTVGGSAMGSEEDRANFLLAIEKSCRYANILDKHGVRKGGVIRIDSAEGPAAWYEDPVANTALIAETFKKAGQIAADNGQRLAAEGEICWAGMHSWKNMLELLEAVDMKGTVGFQADLAHTYLYLQGFNAPEHALVGENPTEEEFWAGYKTMTDALGPWTIDFHIAQSDGTVHGTGDHDKTGRHCPADDPNGKLDITKAAGYWLLDSDGKPRPGIEHMCWDGCMFANELLEQQSTWDTILAAMVDANETHG
mgnify:CR=1 FL=1